jgi:uncharacterized protein DUF4339
MEASAATSQPHSERELYIADSGSRRSPTTLSELRSAFRKGKLHRATRVWTLGWYGWVPLDRVLRLATMERSGARRRGKPPTPPSRRRAAIAVGQRRLQASEEIPRATSDRHAAHFNKTNPIAPAWWLDAADGAPSTQQQPGTDAPPSPRTAALCVVALMLSLGLYLWSGVLLSAIQ